MENEMIYDEDALLRFVQKAIQTRSYSNEEKEFAELMVQEMKKLDYDEVWIDAVGNVIGKMGCGEKIIHFDGHMDTVQVQDETLWKVPPFSGKIVDGNIWGRGSVDMKSALCAAVYGAADARDRGYLEGKTIYVTGTVCEEYCDGENLKYFYKEANLTPDYCIICEPSDNVITLGHKGKAQIRIKSHGVSAHGSAPEKGKNAVYEMAEIIKRVETLNKRLQKKGHPHGTIVLTDISCVSASLNAVPGECTIYLDRRLALGEKLDDVKNEMEELIAGKDASWEVGTLYHTTWTGAKLVYEPMHDPWKIDEDSHLCKALRCAYKEVYGREAESYDFWDFGTNAITPIAMGVPTIGFGPGEYKLAHMRNEHCSVKKIQEARDVYSRLLTHI